LSKDPYASYITPMNPFFSKSAPCIESVTFR